MLSRQKVRDFYDAMFLLSFSKPDHPFLAKKHDIHNLELLKSATEEILTKVDLSIKKRDFEHLLFYKKNTERILAVGEFFREMK